MKVRKLAKGQDWHFSAAGAWSTSHTIVHLQGVAGWCFKTVKVACTCNKMGCEFTDRVYNRRSLSLSVRWSM